MSNSIKISPKHGVNATMPVCFYCHEETGDIALLGKVKRGDDPDWEAPMHVILSYEPCEKCREKFKQGVLLIGVTDRYKYDRPDLNGYYPTGSYAVASADAVNRLFNFEKQSSNGDRVMVENDLLEQLIKDYNEKFG